MEGCTRSTLAGTARLTPGAMVAVLADGVATARRTPSALLAQLFKSIALAA